MERSANTETAKLKMLKKYTLLCVEDESDALGELKQFFERYFAKVYTASTSEEAWELFCRYNQNVIFTDIMLDKTSGIGLARQIRQTDSDSIIVFLSAKTDSDTLIETIGLKPLDFVPKPIKFSKLISLLSKIAEELSMNSVFNDGKIEINFKLMQIKIGNEVSDMTAKEAQLLRLMTSNQGQTVSYDTIKKVVWEDEEMSDSSLKSLLYRIRQKIGKEKIKTLSGVGIRLEI